MRRVRERGARRPVSPLLSAMARATSPGERITPSSKLADRAIASRRLFWGEASRPEGMASSVTQQSHEARAVGPLSEEDGGALPVSRQQSGAMPAVQTSRPAATGDKDTPSRIPRRRLDEACLRS
jgi:hypothetical protein